MSDQAQIQMRQLKYEYQFRLAILGLAALLIILGAVMIFIGVQGSSLEWSVQVGGTISAKLINASPGIVFATIGMVLAVTVTVTLRSANVKALPLSSSEHASLEHARLPGDLSKAYPVGA